VGPTR
jgi:hypothetical protein